MNSSASFNTQEESALVENFLQFQVSYILLFPVAEFQEERATGELITAWLHVVSNL